MPKGKPWTKEEEQQLRELVIRGLKAEDIAAKMDKSKDAVLKKIQRLGLKVVHPLNIGPTTSTELIIPKELPSIEEAPKTLGSGYERLTNAKPEQGGNRKTTQHNPSRKNLQRTTRRLHKLSPNRSPPHRNGTKIRGTGCEAQQACATNR